VYLNSKIYVAGHQGLIGSAFVRALKKEGYMNLLLKNRKELHPTNARSVAVFLKMKSQIMFYQLLEK